MDGQVPSTHSFAMFQVFAVAPLISSICHAFLALSLTCHLFLPEHLLI